MNTLLSRLATLCRDHVVEEKILVVPSLAIGHQIGDRIAQGGTPWINLRVETVRTLADAVASFELTREKIRVLSRAQALSFVEKACDLALGADSYFGRIADRPGFHRAMQRSLDDLRLASIPVVEVRASAFEEQRKAEDLRRLLEAYEKELSSGSFVDRCAVVRRATELLKKGAPTPFEQEAIWIAVDEMDLASAEETFLELVSGGRLIRVGGRSDFAAVWQSFSAKGASEVPKPEASPGQGRSVPDIAMSGEASSGEARSEEAGTPGRPLKIRRGTSRSSRAQLRLFAQASPIPPRLSEIGTSPGDDSAVRGVSIQFGRAVGEENEIRGALRTLFERELSFDQTEMIYTDRGTYLPLIYELTSEYDVPTTFAEGISASFTRPGAAALGFLAWIGSGYESVEIEKIFRGGSIDLYGGRSKGPSARAVARVLRESTIGWGRERYLPRIKAWKGRRELRLADGDLSDSRRQAITRDMEAASVAEEFFHSVLSLTETLPAGEALSIAGLAEACASFVSEYAAVRNEIDGMARSALERMLNELAALPATEVGTRDATDRLQGAVIELHVTASNPRPGHLHVAPVRLGGWAGRRQICVVGLDDAKHPGGGAQDPVLLDAERRTINESIAPRKLALLSDRPLRNVMDFNRLLERTASIAQSRDRTNVFLSYSSHDLNEQRERYPSSTLLQTYRRVIGDGDVTYDVLLNRIASHTSSFVPENVPLSDTEWWFTQLFERPARSSSGSVETPSKKRGRDVDGTQSIENNLARLRNEYRWLAQGHVAEQARASDTFTPWDGAITAPTEELDPRLSGAILSASRLEKLAGCPYRYFLEHVLRVQPLDVLERDADRWLTPADFGSMLHEVLQKFMEEVCASGEKPSTVRHTERLKAIASQSLKSWGEEIPPPNTSAFERQKNDLFDACEVFLRTEERDCSSITARYFEAGFGDGQEPLPRFWIDLGSGRRLQLRGRIDRVDRDDVEALWDVWDYKSGSTFRFEGGGRFRAGTRIQHAIYARVVEAMLAASGDEGKVRRSGYYFASRKGDGFRQAIDVQPGELELVLNLLCDVAASGTFLHADAGNCRFCDYAPVCRNVVQAAERSRRKVEHDDRRPGVSAWQKLQDIE